MPPNLGKGPPKTAQIGPLSTVLNDSGGATKNLTFGIEATPNFKNDSLPLLTKHIVHRYTQPNCAAKGTNSTREILMI